MIPQEVVDAFWDWANSREVGIGEDPEDYGPWLECFYGGWQAVRGIVGEVFHEFIEKTLKTMETALDRRERDNHEEIQSS